MDSSKIWELSKKTGGVFKLTVLLQKRVQELIRGAPKLVEISSHNVLDIALKELEEGKISLARLTDEEIEAGSQELQDEMAAERSILGEGNSTQKAELP
jgi:DNA-directed RNA polymerase subunit K/omega